MQKTADLGWQNFENCSTSKQNSHPGLFFKWFFLNVLEFGSLSWRLLFVNHQFLGTILKRVIHVSFFLVGNSN